MKRLVLTMVLLAAVSGVYGPANVWAYNFGDFRSTTLVTKSWEAFEKGDIEAVLAYTNKCIELYSDQAKKQQAALTDYVTGEKDKIFANWALNDVATSFFIQGEAYRKANMMDEAKEVYKKIVNEYAFGQCWNTKGWFWKPAEAAKEKLAMLESGSNIDFGDHTSSTLATKAWDALSKNDLESVLTYTNKCIEMYGSKSKEMQMSLTEYPWESKEKIFSYWALNDVGTCLFIQGEAYRDAGKEQEAKVDFKKLIDEYSYAQCWDPQGWFWKPAEAAQQKLDLLAQK